MVDGNGADRFDRGLTFFRSVNPEAVDAMQQALGGIAPDLMRYVAEFPFGDLYMRDGLDMRLRQTATLSALACSGHMAQLKIHLQVARKIGLSREELVEIFMQLAPYAGFPVAINAVLAVKDIFEDPASSIRTKQEKSPMYDHQINPPSEPVDEEDTTLCFIDLTKVTLPEGSAPLEQRHLRFRRVDVGPGGIVPFHTHENRPAILFIIEGEIIEYNSRHEQPRRHKAGSIVAEYGDVSHWWKNETDGFVVIYAADLAQIETCTQGEC